MISRIIFFLLFFLAFVVFPIGVSPFETPKILISQVLIEVLFLIFFFTKGLPFQNFTRVGLVIFALIFVFTIIQLALQGSPTSFFGNVFRLQGVYMLWHFMLFAILSSTLSHKEIPKLVPRLSIMLLFLSIFLFGTNDAGRVIGTLGEPNALAAVTTFLFPMIFSSSKTQQKFIFAILTVLIVFFSGSRSGLLAISIEATSLLLYYKMRWPLKKALIIPAALLVLSLFLPFSKQDLTFENRYENRAEIWKTAWAAGWDKPLFGWGFGNISLALQNTSLDLSNNLRYQFVDSAHNVFLDWWVQGGIIGLMLITSVMVYSFVRLLQRKQIIELAIFLGLLAILSFNPVSVVTLLQFWWLIGRGISSGVSTQV